MDGAIAEALGQIGLGVLTNGVYDFLKSQFAGEKVKPAAEVTTQLGNYLTMIGAKVSAQTVLEAIARTGQLEIRGAQLHAGQALALGAEQGGRFILAGPSVAATPKAFIQMGPGTYVEASGGMMEILEDGAVVIRV
jgi:hypothetical protein